jgi:hypothetical protein
MKLNFKDALAALAGALPAVLFRAVFYITGGFLVILVFGVALFALRLAGGVSAGMATLAIALALLGGLLAIRLWQRLFLYRRHAALLFLFSGRPQAAAGLAGAAREAKRFFPDRSSWGALNRRLRQAQVFFIRGGSEFAAPLSVAPAGFIGDAVDLASAGVLSQAVISLAFAREGGDAAAAVREALALFYRHGRESRRLARRWLLFSLAALALLFLCLAGPNWLFFRAAGVPAGIAIVLALAIAWLLHQAFVVPLVLAGVSTALLAETRGQEPDPALCAKVGPLVTP